MGTARRDDDLIIIRAEGVENALRVKDPIQHLCPTEYQEIMRTWEGEKHSPGRS